MVRVKVIQTVQFLFPSMIHIWCEFGKNGLMFSIMKKSLISDQKNRKVWAGKDDNMDEKQIFVLLINRMDEISEPRDRGLRMNDGTISK